mgnify:FL=1
MNLLESKMDAVSKSVNEHMLSYLREREPRRLYEAATHLVKAGGKRIRPFLTITMCKAFGKEEKYVIPVAAALEIIHTFSLIHDDIIDRDKIRRGVQAVHRKWGTPTAMVAGDLLHTKAYQIILDAAVTERELEKVTLKLLSAVNESIIRVCEGQVLDEELEKEKNPSEDQYLQMIEGKTAALFEAAAVAGAIVGGANGFQIEAARNYAHELGIAFQMLDDSLGLTADEKELGKPVGSDLREGKRTLPIIHALATADAKQKVILRHVLGNRKASELKVRTAINTIQRLGSIGYTTRKAEEHARKAQEHIASIPPSAERDTLEQMAEFVVRRRY